MRFLSLLLYQGGILYFRWRALLHWGVLLFFFLFLFYFFSSGGGEGFYFFVEEGLLCLVI